MSSASGGPDVPYLDDLPDGVVVAGADERVEAISALAARMLGTTPAEAVGRPLAEVLRLQDTEGRDWLFCTKPYHGLVTRSGIPEQSWLLPDGTEVLVSARLRRPGPGRPVDRVGLVLRSGRGRARLDRERSDLVATVAHELRSPLTGVKGFVQVMLNRWDRLTDEQKKLMLTTVAADSDRLTRLIAELLDVARIDTGRLQLHRRPADAATLVRRVVDAARATATRPIELRVADGLPPAWADPDKLTQVVANLVENALRHGDGPVTVALEPAAVAEHLGLRLVVEDCGEGIPPALRRTVFTKFWKHGSGGGSGLGLYIVHGLTRAHGGTVEIEDAASGGARVVVRWPAPADL